MKFKLALVVLGLTGLAGGQSGIEELVFEMRQGGPLPPPRVVSLVPGLQWKAAVSGAPWLHLPAPEGSGSVLISVGGEASSEMSGDHNARLDLTTAKEQQSFPVKLRIVPRAPDPKFTYVSPPQGCVATPGLPDEALCTAPDEKPPGNFKPPSPGGSYRDPNFGALVRVLAGPQAIHAYSTPNALSAHNRYALTGNEHGMAAVIDVATSSVQSRPATPFEGAIWDAQDDDTYYYIEGVKVVQFDIQSGKSKTVVDYGRAPWRFTRMTNGGSTDTTKDNWMGFDAPAEQNVCALDIAAKKTYCASYSPAAIGMAIKTDNGTVMIAKGVDKQSGKRYVWIVGQPCGALYSIDPEKGKLVFEHLGPELPDWPGNGDGACQAGERCVTGDHYDMAEDENGVQYLFGGLETQFPCEYSIYRFQLNKGTRFTTPEEIGGGRKHVMTLFRCGGADVWADYHVGCAKAAPFCVFSTTYGAFNSQRKPGDQSPLPRGPHVGEVLVVRTDGTEVRRLMKHRSAPMPGETANSYWSTPRASLSNDGRFVVVDSNFGEANQQRVLLVETGLK